MDFVDKVLVLGLLIPAGIAAWSFVIGILLMIGGFI